MMVVDEIETRPEKKIAEKRSSVPKLLLHLSYFYFMNTSVTKITYFQPCEIDSVCTYSAVIKLEII